MHITSTANCDAIIISWKGNKAQTYTITASYTDATGATSAVAPTYNIACGSDLMCSVTLPVKTNGSINWSIQAVQEIDGRVFQSYPHRGEFKGCNTDHLVPLASTNLIDASSKIVTVASGLTVYPNPATGALTFNWKSEYKGAATVTIMDAAGKAISAMDIKKYQRDYVRRLSVNNLSPGLYYVQVIMQNGQLLTARFIKN